MRTNRRWPTVTAAGVLSGVAAWAMLRQRRRPDVRSAEAAPTHPLPTGAPAASTPPEAAGRDDLAALDPHALLAEVERRIDDGLADARPETMMLADAVADRLRELADVHENRFGRSYHRDVFMVFHHIPAAPKPPIEGADYLELGCGSVNPLGLGLLFLSVGAASYTSIDREAIKDEAKAARAMARLVDTLLADPAQVLLDFPITREEVIANLHDVDVDALRRGDLAGSGPRLRLLNGSAAALPVATDSVDVVLSNSFLEHAEDVDAVVAEMARVTRGGGFAVHQIDGIDHRSYADPSFGPHDFLREPAGPMVYDTNRLRVLQYPEIMERHGFGVHQIVSKRMPIDDQEVAGFAPPWRTMPRDVLETVQALVVTRRRAAGDARTPTAEEAIEQRLEITDDDVAQLTQEWQDTPDAVLGSVRAAVQEHGSGSVDEGDRSS